MESKINENKNFSSSFISFEKKDSDTLCIKPSKNKKIQNFFLTKSKSSWIKIEWLSDNLKKYSQSFYQEMFELHPLERGKVVMFGEDVNSPRWHRSYLRIPTQDIGMERSFM